MSASARIGSLSAVFAIVFLVAVAADTSEVLKGTLVGCAVILLCAAEILRALGK